MKRGVLAITGMHRSGTSLIASWLQRCGLTIDVGGLWGPGVGNPLGHFEDIEIEELHREEFLVEQPKSRGWQLSRPAYLSFTGDRPDRARALAERRSRDYPQWGWKDPRTVVFLPEWQRLMPELVTLIVWRPAVQVVGSLVERAARADNPDMKVSRRRAAQTWLAYNELAIRSRTAEPERTLLVGLDAVLRDDGGALLGVLRERFGFELSTVPLAEMYQEGMLKTARDGAAGLLPVGLRGRAARLETELTRHADL